MSARRAIGKAWFQELLSHNLGWFHKPIALALYWAAALLVALPSMPQTVRGFRVLMRLHSAAFSSHIDRSILKRLSRQLKAERHRPSSLALLFQETASSAAAAFRRGANPQPTRLLGSRILVVKSFRPGDRGVVVVDYQYVFPLMEGLFDLGRVCERYDIVLEPSWADVCAPEILLFTKQQRPVYVQTIEPRDHGVLKELDCNLQAVPIAANWWVDPRRTPPPACDRDIDVIMVAAWADIKRHWRFFRVLADLRRRGTRLKTVLVGYRYDRSRNDIEELARYFGISDQIETYERISQDEVFGLLSRSKLHVLWSRRECANRAIVEAMLADVPVIVREGLTFGYRYPYINEHTGRFVAEGHLGEAILEMIATRDRFSPRAWVVENRTCLHATRILDDTLRSGRQVRGEGWSGELVPKTSELDTQRYFNASDAERFVADYAFMESTVRR